MTDRQQLAFNNPLFSIFLLKGDTLHRVDMRLPTGIWFSTYLTLNAFERPFSWSASAGFVKRITAQGNRAGDAIPTGQWDAEMKVLAMNEVARLLRGVGRSDGGQHWDRAEIGNLSFRAWRRLSPEEEAQIENRRAAEVTAFTVFPDRWEDEQRTL